MAGAALPCFIVVNPQYHTGRGGVGWGGVAFILVNIFSYFLYEVVKVISLWPFDHPCFVYRALLNDEDEFEILGFEKAIRKMVSREMEKQKLVQK